MNRKLVIGGVEQGLHVVSVSGGKGEQMCVQASIPDYALAVNRVSSQGGWPV